MKQETAKAFLKPTKIIWMIIPVAACLIFGTLIGNALGVLDKFPDYDIFLHLLSGILGVAVGYVFIGSGKKPEDKNGIIFVSFASLCFSAAVTCLSEICEFLYDFCMGTNYVHVDLLDDGHWFYRLFGKGLTELIPNQQRILDTDEDMLISVMAAFAATAVLYIGLRIKHKDLCRKKKKVKAAGKKPCLRNRIIDRLYEEKEKLDRECSIADIALWWSVRAVMIYAAFNMVTAEAILLSANLLGTFSISLLHILTSRDSMFNRLNYRLQSVITVIVFLGSWCGNYVFAYGILPRFDLFLHFISGAMSTAAGYFVAKTLIDLKNNSSASSVAMFSFSFSTLVIVSHEIVEFIGDFIWGTTNQGFDWGPTSESFFFKVFGQGAGNTELYYLFDTMYDMLLAMSTTIITTLIIFIFIKASKKQPARSLDRQNELVS